MAHKRIELIVSLVNKGDRVLDIGTDHALVPIYLYKKFITQEIIACDIADKPLEIAKNNIKKNKLEDEIEVLKSDGILEIKNLNDIDTIIIAGMGGKSISKILDQKSLENKKIKKQSLILNPTNNESFLRYTLKKHGFKIIDEILIFENNSNALIIKAKPSKKGYFLTSRSQFLGPILKNKIDENEDVRKYYIQKSEYYWNTYQKSKKYQHLLCHKRIKKLLMDYDRKKGKKIRLNNQEVLNRQN